MQINKTNMNTPQTNLNFKGHVEFPKDDFTRIIRKMNSVDFLNPANKPKKTGQHINLLEAKKSLSTLWQETFSTLKALLEIKFPEEYILKCEESKKEKNLISFSLQKGKEQILDLSTSILNPQKAQRAIEEKVKKLEK